MAVAPKIGRPLYLLARSRRPALVVEFGTSFGLSAIHLAGALLDNGCGGLITTEQSASKAGAGRATSRGGRVGGTVSPLRASPATDSEDRGPGMAGAILHELERVVGV
jgi:predicted O-methyltransferase YrrM